MKIIFTVLSALLFLVLNGCATTQNDVMPVPTITEYFKTHGGGFISSGKTLKYAIQLQTRKPINGTDSWFAKIEYDNPENLQKPLVQSIEFAADQIQLHFTSDELRAIINHKTYKVLLKAYSNSERTMLVATHEMYVRFDMPDQIAKSFGVTILQ